jgi:hypothetical protein
MAANIKLNGYGFAHSCKSEAVTPLKPMTHQSCTLLLLLLTRCQPGSQTVESEAAAAIAD